MASRRLLEAERQPPTGDRKRQQGSKHRQARAISNERPRRQRARREMEIQDHRKRDGGDDAKVHTEDERRRGSELAERDEPREDRRPWNRNVFEVPTCVRRRIG